MRTLAAVLSGIALGAVGVLAAGAMSSGPATPSLYTNASGRDPLRNPDRHIAAAVEYRGTVLGDRLLADGDLVAMRVDGSVVAARVYDPRWVPAHLGQSLEIEGRIRGVLGDPIDGEGLPSVAPVRAGMTLIDVSAAIGPHRSRALSIPQPALRASATGHGKHTLRPASHPSS